MNGQEIIEMAREAGVIATKIDGLERFAQLVAAKYETALIDYIEHVGYCEGTDFISDIDWVENKTSVEIIKAASAKERARWDK